MSTQERDDCLDTPWRRQIDRNSKYFCSDDMPKSGRDLTVKIERVTRGKLEGFSSGKKMDPKGTLFLHFVGIKKPLGLNRTNGDTVEQVTGSEKPRGWLGQLLTLYVAQVNGTGGKTEGIRIRPRKPTEAQWQACQAGYKAPPFDIDLALKSIAEASTVDELEIWRDTVRSIPPEHVTTVREAWSKAKAALEFAAAGEGAEQ